MTWHQMGIEMIRIMNISRGVSSAHFSLIKSPFALSIRNVWMQVYQEGNRTGRVPPVELMSRDDRLTLWNDTKSMCPDTPKEILPDVARVFYTVEIYLNLHENSN